MSSNDRFMPVTYSDVRVCDQYIFSDALAGDWGMQPYISGTRCYAQRVIDKYKFFKRDGTPLFGLERIEKLLNAIKRIGKNIIFDGQLAITRVKPKKKDEINITGAEYSPKLKEKTIFIVQDIFDTIDPDLPYLFRYRKIRKIFKSNETITGLIYMPVYHPDSSKDIWSYIRDACIAEMAGVIFKNIYGPYKQITEPSPYASLFGGVISVFEILGAKADKKKGIVWLVKTAKGNKINLMPDTDLQGRRKIFVDYKKNPKQFIGHNLTVMSIGVKNDGSPDVIMYIVTEYG